MENGFHDGHFLHKDRYVPSGNWDFYESASHPGCPKKDKDCDFIDNFYDKPISTFSTDLNSRSPVVGQDFQLISPSGSLDQKEDPFSIRCRIPVPDMEPMSGYQIWLETSFMCRRNERERQRVRSVNDGFSRLRNHLPRHAHMRRRQSKVETLRHAIEYIKQLQMLLESRNDADNDNQK